MKTARKTFNGSSEWKNIPNGFLRFDSGGLGFVWESEFGIWGCGVVGEEGDKKLSR